jgi:hypothetical protein
VLVNEPQQMIFGNLIFEAEVVKQGFRAGVVSHHEQQASKYRNRVQHEKELPCFHQISPANLSDFFNTHG